MLGLSIEMIVPRDIPADSWSLFEVRGSQSLRMEKCCLTVRNASDQLGTYHQEVAFFRSRAALDADAEAASPAPPTPESAELELVDCVVRGEAPLLRSEDLQPLSAAAGAIRPPSGEVLRLQLRHVTAIVRGGLVRLASSQINSHQPPVQIDCADTILSTSTGGTLIEQVGDDDLDDLRDRITWSGDRNFYEGFETFWAIRRLDPETPPDLLASDAWKSYWGPEHENLPRLGKVKWKKLPAEDRPAHAMSPADFALDPAPDNPAVGTASDGHDAGCLIERLPTISDLPEIHSQD